MEDAPKAYAPFRIDVTEGRRYKWCACGLSKTQPYCDNSHKGTGIEPLTFTAESDREVWLCHCKATTTPPYCDGTHHRVNAQAAEQL